MLEETVIRPSRNESDRLPANAAAYQRIRRKLVREILPAALMLTALALR